MNLRDVQSHSVALDDAFGLGAPLASEAQYERGEYENRVHPWPDTSTPATVLTSLMLEHGLRQTDLPEIGAQSVVSAVLAGKFSKNSEIKRAIKHWRPDTFRV